MPHDSSRSSTTHNQWFNDNGNAWAHWEYSPEEWALFERVDWQSAQLRYWLPNVIVPMAIFLLILLFFLVGFFQIGAVTIVGFGMIVLMGVLFMVRVYDYIEARKRHQARRNQTQLRVTLARKGVWEAGTFFELSGLRTVRLTAQPTVLHFRCRHRVYSTHNGNSSVTYNYNTVRVLVPRGREGEAAQLLERFHEMIREIQQYKAPQPAEPD